MRRAGSNAGLIVMFVVFDIVVVAIVLALYLGDRGALDALPLKSMTTLAALALIAGWVRLRSAR
jgi:hypothetical protein